MRRGRPSARRRLTRDRVLLAAYLLADDAGPGSTIGHAPKAVEAPRERGALAPHHGPSGAIAGHRLEEGGRAGLAEFEVELVAELPLPGRQDDRRDPGLGIEAFDAERDVLAEA